MQTMVEHHSSLKLRTFLYNGTVVNAISCRPNVQYLSILTSEFDQKLAKTFSNFQKLATIYH